MTRVEATTYAAELPDLGRDYNTFNTVYEPGGRLTMRAHVVSIHTDQGLVGEYPAVGGPTLAQVGMVAGYLIGKDALGREKIYNDCKRGLRHYDMTGVGIVDICLWDIAGKFYDAPLYQLLGGTRRPLPAYASTLHGDENGGLTTPEQFSDFAVECLAMGYPAFKIHGWGLAGQHPRREIENVLLMGRRVGGKMDLMIDPACEVENFAQALALGRACDEAGFFWWEDPFRDGGVSCFAHRKLRQMVRTPLLQTEHIRLLEMHVDFIVGEGTDLVRAGAHEDGGITGAMKIAHAAEGFGLDVELHGPGPVHRHVMTSVRNTNYYELGLVHPRVKTTRLPLYADYNDDLDAIDAQGCVWAPEGPGIGVPLDWDWIRAHQVGHTVLASV
ncbi:MAG: mandelate racemase [Armatimonadetes bacterium]|nr:mandelate racemase [Armatimonadota bacterium]